MSDFTTLSKLLRKVVPAENHVVSCELDSDRPIALHIEGVESSLLFKFNPKGSLIGVGIWERTDVDESTEVDSFGDTDMTTAWGEGE